jgi:hypothetical protein
MDGNIKKGCACMKSIDRMGVMLLMSHLIITLVILAIYGYTLHTGQGDETLKTILTVIIGYWFGSMGADAIRKQEKPKRKEEEK